MEVKEKVVLVLKSCESGYFLEVNNKEILNQLTKGFARGFFLRLGMTLLEVHEDEVNLIGAEEHVTNFEIGSVGPLGKDSGTNYVKEE